MWAPMNIRLLTFLFKMIYNELCKLVGGIKMSKNKKSFKLFLSFILSILMMATITLTSSITAKAVPVSGQAIVNEAKKSFRQAICV